MFRRQLISAPVGSLQVAVILVIASTTTALATDRAWNSSSTGPFNTATNWTPNGVPTNADKLTLRQVAPATYSVTFPGKVTFPLPVYEMNQLRVGNNTVTFSDALTGLQAPGTVNVTNTSTAIAPRGIIVGEDNIDTAAVLNTSLANFNAVAATLGDVPGSKGTLNVTGGAFNITGASPTDDELVVANQGYGELNITNGAHLNVLDPAGSVLLARFSGEQVDGYHARLTIDGLNSQLNNAGHLEVGRNDLGIVRVINGGSLISHTAEVKSGVIQLDGVGSSGDIDELTLNPSGIDPFTTYTSGASVLNGAHLTTGSAVLKKGAFYSLSSVLVDGVGSTWTNSGDIQIGSFDEPDNSLHIRSGGRVSVGGKLIVGSFFNNITGDVGTIEGDVENHGNMFLDGPGVNFTIDGNFYSGGTVYLRITDTSNYSKLHVTGDMTMLSLDVFWTSNVRQVGDTFDLLDVDGTTLVVPGSGFMPTLPTGLAWNMSQFATTGVVSVDYRFAADFDLDNDVDHIDLALWRGGFGTSGNATRLQGDANGDLNVDGRDYLILQREFGSDATPAVASGEGVPEPGTCALWLTAALGGAASVDGRRRRRGRRVSNHLS